MATRCIALTKPRPAVAWERVAVLLVEGHGFLDGDLELTKHLPGIVAVDAAVEELGAAADEAVVLVRPLDELGVLVAFGHGGSQG